MIRKTVTSILVGSMVLLSCAGAFAEDKLSLTELISEALKNSPELAGAKIRIEAASARIPQAKALEDPSIGLAFEKTPRGSLKFNKAMPEDRMLSFTQFLPFFGKLKLKGQIALVEYQMAAAVYKNKELEIVNMVRNAYYDLFMNFKERELNKESLILLEGIVKVAESRYAVGQAEQEEVYKLYLEVARLRTVLQNLEHEAAASKTRLNTLLNRDPEGALGIPELSDELSFSPPDIRELYQETVLNQPALATFAYAIEKNKYAKSLAKRSFFPDLMATIVQRGITSGTLGPWDLMLSFTVPLWFWTKQRYQVKEAIANLEEAEAAYKAMQNKAFSEVRELVSRIEIAKSRARLGASGLIPILESSIEISFSSFRSGKGDFMALLDNQRMLLDTKMAYFKDLVDYNMNLAALERAVGTDLTEVKK